MNLKKLLLAAVIVLAPTIAFAGSKFSFSFNMAPFFPSVVMAPRAPCPPPVYVEHYYHPYAPMVPRKPMIREYYYTEYHHYYPFAE